MKPNRYESSLGTHTQLACYTEVFWLLVHDPFSYARKLWHMETALSLMSIGLDDKLLALFIQFGRMSMLCKE